jgi:magnesium chelatase family protein
MTSKINAYALRGIEAVPITVECDLLRRLPSFVIVGLPAHAVRETADRVRSAIVAIGKDFPRQRVIISLAPADLGPGTHVDLPIALAVLQADGQIAANLDGLVFAAELSLNGELRPVKGMVAMAEHAAACGLTLVVPLECLWRVATTGCRVVGFRTLGELLADLPYLAPSAGDVDPYLPKDELTLLDLGLPWHAWAAASIAVAGHHPLLIEGPPGCGKAALARRMPSLMPPMTTMEAREVRRIHDAAGMLDRPGVLRPFRAPHHTVALSGLCGDQSLRPGELTLAHQGVLLLDEVNEFRSSALEVIFRAIEHGTVAVQRQGQAVSFPTKALLVATRTPGPRSAGSFELVLRLGPSETKAQALAPSDLGPEMLARVKAAIAEVRSGRGASTVAQTAAALDAALGETFFTDALPYLTQTNPQTTPGADHE